MTRLRLAPQQCPYVICCYYLATISHKGPRFGPQHLQVGLEELQPEDPIDTGNTDIDETTI